MRYRNSYVLLLALTIGPVPRFACAAQLPISTPVEDGAKARVQSSSPAIPHGTLRLPAGTANLGGPIFVVAGDFNGDGTQDLAMIGTSLAKVSVPAVYILTGNGGGTFAVKTTLTGFTNPTSLVLADLNGDGKLDMAVIDAGTNSVTVYLGNGDGTVGSPFATSSLGTLLSSYGAALDLNKDGKRDLVISDRDNTQVVVLLGNGDGTFQAVRRFPLPAQGWGAVVGDSNADPEARTKSLDGNSLRASWAPPDVSKSVPAVTPGAPCAQEEILQGATQRVQELAANLEQFTATERVEHLELDKHGKTRLPQIRTFSYFAAIRKVGAGLLAVEEYRNGDSSPAIFPAHLATIGLPAFALIFYPVLRDEFEMTCEGLGQWRQQPAWQIYFQSRLDRPPRFREYKIGEKRYPVRLRGRAWIAADTHQVLRMETDLLQPIPQIPLRLEHLAIEYRPVEFAKRHLQVWLPEMAEVYMDYRGRRLLRRHLFSQFMLFSVDVMQQIQPPAQP